ncbi:hypothetical protein BAE44_0008078 [Dichanthelium oligosanthes]|uniref:F-box/kelch-repeat protein n=1 Tax=Dichanthelium oligosanthes TaxID=888268 RepID=A0A1E5W0I4_9POAL|nr:hypothetical protein BAE44_0008078 [Dichanthelium oligosanthes]
MLRSEKITCHALHPGERTIFMSTDSNCTYSLDTSNGGWKELGDWVLPFKGQAYFDRDLEAWVGLHGKEDGCVGLCPVASRSAAATQPPECTMLKEKLCRYREGDAKYHRSSMWLRTKATTLTYMGDSIFCLVKSSEHVDRGGSVVHVTVFGLKYHNNGELRTKAHRTTRSYAVSKNGGTRFSHATFWI